eukprot:UN2267
MEETLCGTPSSRPAAATVSPVSTSTWIGPSLPSPSAASSPTPCPTSSSGRLATVTTGRTTSLATAPTAS